MTFAWSQIAIVLLGGLHAIAAFLYFSKAKRASCWAAGWILFAISCAWWLPAQPGLSLAVFGAAILLWMGWWTSIRALRRRAWVDDNTYQATGRIKHEQLVIHHLRNFEWRSKDAYTARWEEAVFDLNALEAIDLFTSTWGDPRLAHLIVSFVFRDHPPLAFSIETRRETTEKWSGLAGFMKSYELIIIAARETDLVQVRTNIRGETVHRYRLLSTPMMRRKLLAQYLKEMNRLAKRPRFYNTVLSNCTTEVARILRAAGRGIPFSWPLIVSGYVPRFFYQIGLLDNTHSFAEIEAAADIGERARDQASRVDFSRRIRQPAR
jgi:Domain of unknown function (DUF4105)